MGVERIDYSSNEEFQQALQQERAQEEDAYQQARAREQLEEDEHQQIIEQLSKEKLDIIKEKAMEHAVVPLILKCKKCDLYKTKKNYVPGKGNASAEMLFIGEAPGREEDEQGKPFIGNAGTILNLLLETAGFREKDYFISNIIKCLDGKTLIKTEYGNKRLNWIVKNKWKGKVYSINKNNEICLRPITNWYKNKLNNRKMYQLNLLPEKNNSHGKSNILLTEDHPVLTKRGYIQVKNLKNTDKMATGTPYPNPLTYQLIIGSLLGDGGINKAGHYSEGHSIKQKDYFKAKARILNTFCPKFYFYKKTNSILLYTKNIRFFKQLYKEWYPSGKKIFPAKELKKLNDFGLAIWYMDDGYYKNRKRNTTLEKNAYVEIALGDITEENAKETAKIINKKGYKCYISFQGTWRLIFRYGKGYKFLKNIAEYIVPSMRYKLPKELQKIPFNNVYVPQSGFTDWAKIKIKKIKYSPKSVHCVDVKENHNFVTTNGVVHNCRPPNNRTPEKHEIRACLGHLINEISIIQPNYIICLGNCAVNTLFNYFGLANSIQPISRIHGQLFTGVNPNIDKKINIKKSV